MYVLAWHVVDARFCSVRRLVRQRFSIPAQLGESEASAELASRWYCRKLVSAGWRWWCRRQPRLRVSAQGAACNCIHVPLCMVPLLNRQNA